MMSESCVKHPFRQERQEKLEPNQQLLKDPYGQVYQSGSLVAQVEHMYHVLREFYSGIERFALALYCPEEQALSSFIYQSDDISPLIGYRLPLSQAPSLQQLADSGEIRVVDDMRVFRETQVEQKTSSHSNALLAAGYRSSYTMPLFCRDRLLGFLFLNSRKPEYFNGAMAAYCNLWGHMVGQLLSHEREAVERLQAVLNFAVDIAGRRSMETASHVKRISGYARLIARGLQKKLNLSDDFIEYLALFAPLHDIGKVAISDDILHKPGPLTEAEFSLMRGS